MKVTRHSSSSVLILSGDAHLLLCLGSTEEHPKATAVISAIHAAEPKPLQEGNTSRPIDGAGEYEVSGVRVFGYALDTTHTVYVLEAEGLTLCAVGDGAPALSPTVLEAVVGCDAVLLGVQGDGAHLDALQARVAELESKLVIPVGDSSVVDEFASRFGEVPAKNNTLTLTRSAIPHQTTLSLLS